METWLLHYCGTFSVINIEHFVNLLFHSLYLKTIHFKKKTKKKNAELELKGVLLSFSRYVSTNYITDCIDQNKQLNLEDYKLDPLAVRKYSTRVGNNNKPSYTSLLGGIDTFQQENTWSLSHVNL